MQSTINVFRYDKKKCTFEAGAEQAFEDIRHGTALFQLAAKCAKLSSGLQGQALQNRPLKEMTNGRAMHLNTGENFLV